jgi:hypothetical protein
MKFGEIQENLDSLFQKQIDKKVFGHVDARPTDAAAAATWDNEYGQTHYDDGTPIQGAPGNAGNTAQRGNARGTGSVSYVQGFNNKTRNKPIQPALMRVLNRAATEAGVKVVIFSGGQDAEGTPNARRTGSTRHDNGYAADVHVYDAEGKQLKTDGRDPLVTNFVAALKKHGAKGFGAHPGYMAGVGIHVDLWGAQKGGEMWGAGGTGSPTSVLAQAWSTGRGTATA